jgi:hypothetical protein
MAHRLQYNDPRQRDDTSIVKMMINVKAKKAPRTLNINGIHYQANDCIEMTAALAEKYGLLVVPYVAPATKAAPAKE